MNNDQGEDHRILAITVASQRMGYVVLEGSNFLVEWGCQDLRYLSHQKQLEKACKTMAWYLPDLVVLEDVQAAGCRKGAASKRLVIDIKKEAVRRRIGVTVVSRLDIRRHFADQGGVSKDLVARLVCNHLPELIRLLPEPRRTWQPEQHCMPVFEAASMAIVYWQKT